MVECVMQTPRLLPQERAFDNQLSHQRQVAQFDQVRCDLVVPVESVDLCLQILNASTSAQETLVRADDAHIVPHAAPNLFPVVRNNDEFVSISSIACLPGR